MSEMNRESVRYWRRRRMMVSWEKRETAEGKKVNRSPPITIRYWPASGRSVFAITPDK